MTKQAKRFHLSKFCDLPRRRYDSIRQTSLAEDRSSGKIVAWKVDQGQESSYLVSLRSHAQSDHVDLIKVQIQSSHIGHLLSAS